MPAIALKIIELVQEDEVDVDKIAETISLDPALSSKMLRTVNSSFYGLPKTVGSVHQAVVVLGLNSVKTLALGFSLVNNLTGAGGEGFDHISFWRRSLYSATAAKQLCEKLNIVQAEEVFMSSLLQDVGVLALAQVLEGSYASLMKTTGGDHRLLSKAERMQIGGDHTEIGAALAESWSLPPLLVESIRLHERPDEAAENLRPLIRTVYAGGLAAALIEHPDDEQRVTEYHRVLQEWFGMQQPAAEDLLRKVFRDASETQRLFDLPTGELGVAEQIMAQASKALKRVKDAESCAKPEPAKPKSTQPAEKPKPLSDSKIDPVTGLPCRRIFDEQLDERFVKVVPKQPLSVVFVDLDSFAAVNDAVGREKGDEVLKRVAGLLVSESGGKGEVYRYGDDDFTLLCTGLSRADAALLAEKLRAAIEKLKCEVGAQNAVAVTASIGVATYEGVVFKRPEQLVKAASKGVFAAKDGGRNRVRVFVPKETGSKAA